MDKEVEHLSETNRMLMYQEEKVDSGKIWLLFLLFGWSYGSMNQMGKQIFYYLTLGGCGLWALYRLFTLNGKIKDYNVRLRNKYINE